MRVLNSFPALALLAGIFFTTSAAAATIEVDTLDPVGTRHDCSLTAASIAASENRAHARCRAGDATRIDEIRFAPSVRGTIRLSAPVDFVGPTALLGPGSRDLAIDGAILMATPGASGEFSIRHLTIGSGLLLRDARRVEVESMRFVGIVSQLLGGSAIAAPGAVIGDLRIRNSEFLDTQGEFGAVGLTWNAHIGAVTVEASRFEGNLAYGGGAGALYIDADVGSLSITDSDFVDNRASAGYAGAVAVMGVPIVHVRRSTFHDNEGGEAGALFGPHSYLRVRNSSFLRNTGSWAAAILDGRSGSDIRFSAIVDNGDPYVYAPSIARWGNGGRAMLGNLLRAPALLPVCDATGAQLHESNRTYGGPGCGHGYGDIDYLSEPLFMMRIATDRPRAPVPMPTPLHVDRIAHWECLDDELLPIVTDIRGRTRPAWYSGEPDPYGWCDIGPFELRAGDFANPAP